MDKLKLTEILKKHVAWLEGKHGGERANLYGANLYEANLRGADLRGADLYGANLYEANLYGANLRGADLRGANLCEADLCEADLCGANLRGANLYEANLCGANLCEANLRGADLRGADLYGANLCEANLCEANLREANLCGANLCEADLYGADLCGAKIEERIKIKFFPLICPEEGAFIGWKTNGNYIIKLRVTEDAKRSSAYGRKCRCSKAEVLEIQDFDGAIAPSQSVPSYRDPEFLYTKGQTVEVSDFDENRWNECSTGIHFFITRQEAVDYML